MATISVNKISPFDAAKGLNIYFRYEGNQCVKNTLKVYETESNTLVYTNEVETLTLVNSIPPNELTNGVGYYCTITAYWQEETGFGSVVSSAASFMCLKTPTWCFVGITDGFIIRNSSVSLSILYEQENGELLDEFEVFIYDSSRDVMFDSGPRYDTASTTFTVSGFNSGKNYYLRAVGKTVNGFELDTRQDGEDIGVSVSYSAPDTANTLAAENMRDGGIAITSNINSVDGEYDGEPVYVGDTAIDLTDGKPVIFPNNCRIEGNYEIVLKVRNPQTNAKMLGLSNAKQNMDFYFRRGTLDAGERFWVEGKMHVTDFYTITLLSNMIQPPESGDTLKIYLAHKNGLFDIIIKEESGA